MPKIYFSRDFIKQYKLLSKRNPNLVKKLEKLTEIFINNPKHPILKTHSLSGKLQGKYAFWISWDLRVVFEWLDNKSVRFLVLGTHDKVYK
jgi:addiction module RelE/StbE family toxin